MKKANDCTRYIGSDDKVYSIWPTSALRGGKPHKMQEGFTRFMVECDKDYIKVTPNTLKQFAFTLYTILEDGSNDEIIPNKPPRQSLEYFEKYIGFDTTIEDIHYYSFDISKDTKVIMFEDLVNSKIHMRSDGFTRTITRREAKIILEITRNILIQSGFSKDMEKGKRLFLEKKQVKKSKTTSPTPPNKILYNNKGELIHNSDEEDSDFILKRSIWTTKYGKKKHILNEGRGQDYFCGAYHSSSMDTKIGHIEDLSELTIDTCIPCTKRYRKQYVYELKKQSKTI